MELDVTWKRVVRIWWSFCWMSLIGVGISALIGGGAAFLVALAMGALGFPLQTIEFVTFPLAFIVALGVSIVPMKMILGRDFGEFRLVLIAKETPNTRIELAMEQKPDPELVSSYRK